MTRSLQAQPISDEPSKAAASAASWRPYPEYRESGAPWLGQVPAHWDVRRLKTSLVRNEGGVWGEDFDPDGTIVLRSTEQAVDGKWIIEEPARRMLSSRERSATLLNQGDLVITKSSGSALHIGKTSLVDAEVASLECCYSNFMQRLRCATGAEPRFVHYVLNSPIGREQFDYGSNTTTGLANLNGAIIGNLRVAWPPLAEQRAIAAFLDRKTREIDELIEKKRRLIDLLHEKRTALISHAVTKGLNHDAPMKPSGVEWLGDVPEHWEVKSLKFLSKKSGRSFTDGDWIETPYVTYSGIRLLQCGNVGTGRFEEQGFRCISEETFAELNCTEVHANDVLICRMRSSPTILAGRACLAPDLGCRMITAVDNCILKVDDHNDPRFVVYQLTVGSYLEFIENVARGGTRDRISRSMLGSIRVIAPPRHEQSKIADFLDEQLRGVGQLLTQIESAVARLDEYRLALISAAVTGKIDVREEAPHG